MNLVKKLYLCIAYLIETMSFKKQQPYQPEMFNVPQLPLKLEKQFHDPMASHNQFYRHVFCKIPDPTLSDG